MHLVSLHLLLSVNTIASLLDLFIPRLFLHLIQNVLYLFQRFSHPTIQPLVQSDNEENCEYDRDNDTGSTGNVNNESRSSEKERLIN